MELDFDKYCVVDTSPTTVLAPRRSSRASNRKPKEGQPKCGDDNTSRLKEDLSEIRLHHFRSASCRDVPSHGENHSEMLKRGSVYQSSKEVRGVRRMDEVEGRRKIEFSRGSASALSLGIIDSLCSSDEDGDLLDEQHRFSIMSRLSGKKLCSQESLPSSIPPIWKNGRPSVTVTRLDGMENRVSVKSPQSRQVNVNLNELLPKKLDFPHSPAKSVSGNSNANSPKISITPVNKALDPFLVPKLQKSPLSSAGDDRWQMRKQLDGKERKITVLDSNVLNGLSDKPDHKECISEFDNKKNHDSFSELSPVHFRGLLRLESKQGVPFLKFWVKSPLDVYVAQAKKGENALTWVYTIHSLHGKRKSNAKGWGMKEGNRESSVVGRIEVSCRVEKEMKGIGSLNEYMVTEFILSYVPSSRRSISYKDNRIHLPDDKAYSFCGEFPLQDRCKLNEQLRSETRTFYPPEHEIAAVVMNIPLKKRESLKFKSDHGNIEKIFPNIIKLCHFEQEKEQNSEMSRLGKMHVVLPSGNHSMPLTESRGPSPLLDRWRLGGGCDCGGWDMSCPIDIFGNENIRISEGILGNQHPLELFIQGRKKEVPAFTMSVTEVGKYAVDFHARLSSLQAFAICVAILHTAEVSPIVGQEQSRHFQQYNPVKVFAEEEIRNLMGSISDENKTGVSGKIEESIPCFVLNPPFSPISRV